MNNELIINLKSSGIYLITNKINNKKYIGSAVNLIRRQKWHLTRLKNDKHYNSHLQRAYNKYGKENFYFQTLVTCPPEYVLKLEQWFIDTLNPEYNICLIAGNTFGVKHGPEVLKIIAEKNRGKKRSKESIEGYRETVVPISKRKEIVKMLQKDHTYRSIVKNYPLLGKLFKK